jgi:predicted enzyme related to lactoylglutathione lyase
MNRIQARFVGVELYFENLDRAKKFYAETMGWKSQARTLFCKNQLERRYCAPKRTDTNFETPGSCMVTP